MNCKNSSTYKLYGPLIRLRFTLSLVYLCQGKYLSCESKSETEYLISRKPFIHTDGSHRATVYNLQNLFIFRTFCSISAVCHRAMTRYKKKLFHLNLSEII